MLKVYNNNNNNNNNNNSISMSSSQLINTARILHLQFPLLLNSSSDFYCVKNMYKRD